MKHPAYSKNTDEIHLFNELRKRVNQRIQEIPENRDRYIQIKAIILPIVYFGSYFLAIFNGDKPWLLYNMLYCNGAYSGFNLSESDS